MDVTIEKHDEALDGIIGDQPSVDRLAAGFGFTEGPVWRGDHLLFSDIPNNRIVRFNMTEEGPHVSTFRYPSGNSNGHTLDGQGRLVSAEHSNRRVSRTDANGTVSVVANRYQGKRLNSPNDVVVKSDGSVYFTDPPYGLPGRTQGKELDFNGVFRVSPDGNELTIATDEMEGPNGLAFTPDESRLYIGDSFQSLINVFDVNSDGSLSNGRLFAELKAKEGEQGVPDGMKVDSQGNLHTSGPGGMWIYAPDGNLLGRILTPEVPANCAWGDDDWKTLYLTARTGLYRMRMNVEGIKVG